MRRLSKKEISDFQKIIYRYYKKHGRKLPWRPPLLKLRKDKFLDPYKILVSEVMLQQTQVLRVLKKYSLFIKQFPTMRALARAPFHAVLSLWSGLGYNRRAKFLHEAAKIIVKKHQGIIPKNVEALVELPGIGEGTAGAIVAFAFNKPSVFIETNIRTVFIHYFFKSTKIYSRHSHILENVRMSCGGNLFTLADKKIHDKEILPLIEKTLDRKNPREWYYALMDYGVYIKSLYVNPSRKSAHHGKQSPFKNSNRQARGEILKLLVEHRSVPKEEIKKHLTGNTKFAENALMQLTNENFIRIHKNNIRLVT